MIRTILTIIFTILVILFGIVALLGFFGNSGHKGNYTKLYNVRIPALICTIIIGVLLVLIPSSYHQVETGQVAVVKKLGKIVNIREPGTYFDFYLTRDYTYFDTTVQKVDMETTCFSSDAQTVGVSLTLQYQINPESADKILTEYVSMASLESRMVKVCADRLKSIVSQYTAIGLLENRSKISPEVADDITNSIGDKYYTKVSAVNLTNFDFTDEFEKAAEDKVVAEQNKQAAITKAEEELEVTKLQAEAKIEKAKGDAEAQKILAEAEGQAAAMKMVEVARSLGFPIVTTYTYDKIETIDGKEVKTKVESEHELISDTDVRYELVTTKYTITYDDAHTKEDFANIVYGYVKYLAYLATWNGILPEVVSGSDALDILIPKK